MDLCVSEVARLRHKILCLNLVLMSMLFWAVYLPVDFFLYFLRIPSLVLATPQYPGPIFFLTPWGFFSQRLDQASSASFSKAQDLPIHELGLLFTYFKWALAYGFRLSILKGSLVSNFNTCNILDLNSLLNVLKKFI